MTTTLPVPLRLYLIRHGETEWSLSGQHSGRSAISLTAQGEDEARAVGKRLRDVPFTHVLTSPLRRAQQTCALAALGPTPKIDPDLAEWDNGDDEGRTSAEILKSRPGWNLFRDGSLNGEAPAQISGRADRFIARVRALAGNVALFSHSHFGRVLAARWVGWPVAQAQHLLLNTASVSVLCYEHERTDQPAIALWNSTAHETFDPASEPNDGEGSASKRRAIDRWENEGGEIPNFPTPQPAAMSAVRSPGKKLFVFDLDGTLAESKAALNTEMAVPAKTLLGIDKAYGIKKLREILGIELDAMLFAGDALFPEGNDYPVEEAGVASLQVNNAEETKRVIETFLAGGVGIESAAHREEVAR